MPVIAQNATGPLPAILDAADWDVSPAPTVTVQTLAGVEQTGFPSTAIVHDGLGLYHYDWAVPLAQGIDTYDVHFAGFVGGAAYDGWDTVEVVVAGSVPMTIYYSTPAKVLTRTGTDPGDLGFGTAEELTEFVEGLLEEIADLMNQKLGRDYMALLDAGTITAIPKGLSGIAADIGADCLRTMAATRGSSVVRIDDFAVATVRARVFSDDILERLRLYGHHGVRSVTMSNR